MQQLVNLTSYKINILNDKWDIVFSIHPDPNGPAEIDVIMETINNVTVMSKVNKVYRETIIDIREPRITGKVRNLPSPKKGVYFIVSKLVKLSCPDRKDLVIPDQIVINNDKCKIKGCRSFKR